MHAWDLNVEEQRQADPRSLLANSAEMMSFGFRVGASKVESNRGRCQTCVLIDIYKYVCLHTCVYACIHMHIYHTHTNKTTVMLHICAAVFWVSILMRVMEAPNGSPFLLPLPLSLQYDLYPPHASQPQAISTSRLERERFTRVKSDRSEASLGTSQIKLLFSPRPKLETVPRNSAQGRTLVRRVSSRFCPGCLEQFISDDDDAQPYFLRTLLSATFLVRELYSAFNWLHITK